MAITLDQNLNITTSRKLDIDKLSASLISGNHTEEDETIYRLLVKRLSRDIFRDAGFDLNSYACMTVNDEDLSLVFTSFDPYTATYATNIVTLAEALKCGS